ncbi:MAG: ATP-binding protein, partial [Candidatus Dojkabacteria bacterium]
HTRKPEIRHFPDRTIFWNPGDAFTATDLLEPGPKEVRNPNIVLAFRRIGLSENAGSGLRDVCNNWQQLGHVLPIIDNGKAGKTFQLTLLNDTQQVTEQVTEQVRRLLTVLHGETAATMEIMTWLELRHRPTFLYSYLNPAIENGLIEMTIPDKPRSSNQKYRLTPKGRKLIRELSDAGSD